MTETKWKELIGNKVLLDAGWNHYIEARILGVSPNELYVQLQYIKNENIISHPGHVEWISIYKYRIADIL